MIDIRTQTILKKKWGITYKLGEVITKSVILERRFWKKNNVRYFSFLSYECIGKKYWKYLGESDYLGRPI